MISAASWSSLLGPGALWPSQDSSSPACSWGGATPNFPGPLSRANFAEKPRGGFKCRVTLNPEVTNKPTLQTRLWWTPGRCSSHRVHATGSLREQPAPQPAVQGRVFHISSITGAPPALPPLLTGDRQGWLPLQTVTQHSQVKPTNTSYCYPTTTGLPQLSWADQLTFTLLIQIFFSPTPVKKKWKAHWVKEVVQMLHRSIPKVLDNRLHVHTQAVVDSCLIGDCLHPAAEEAGQEMNQSLFSEGTDSTSARSWWWDFPQPQWGSRSTSKIFVVHTAFALSGPDVQKRVSPHTHDTACVRRCYVGSVPEKASLNEPHIKHSFTISESSQIQGFPI